MDLEDEYNFPLSLLSILDYSVVDDVLLNALLDGRMYAVAASPFADTLAMGLSYNPSSMGTKRRTFLLAKRTFSRYNMNRSFVPPPRNSPFPLLSWKTLLLLTRNNNKNVEVK